MSNKRGALYTKPAIPCNKKINLMYEVMVKRAAKTCNLFAALLLDKLNSDVARFTTNESNLSCSKTGCIVMQKVESSYTSCNRICSCCTFYRPKANLFCNKWRKSHVWRDSRVILSNQKVSIRATCNYLICCKIDSKTRSIFFQRVLQQCCKTGCTFLLPVLS